MSETIAENVENASDIDVYDTLEQMVERTFQISKQVEEESVPEYEGVEYYKALLRALIDENKGFIVTTVLFVVVALHMISGVMSYAKSIMVLDYNYLQTNIAVYLFWVMFPFGVWIWSTKYEAYVFWNRKLRLMTFCLINMALQSMVLLAGFISSILFPIFVRINFSQDITVGMVCNLLRGIIFIFSIVPIMILFRLIITEVYKPLTKREIINFKITKICDGRKDKKYLYDMVIVKNLETCTKHVIEEKDRYLHAVANGVTGTGKTSMCFTTAINADLEQIVYNMQQQKKDCERLLSEKKIRLKYALNDEDFNIDAFEACEKQYEKELSDIKFGKKVAGITAIAPDASFADTIYGLAHSKGLKVNRIDPLLGEDGFLKPDFRGFNPLYITEGLNEVEFIIEASRKAILYADVLQAIFDAQGSGDVYFASLNKNITTTATMMLMFTFPAVKGRQPNPEDVQLVLNTFKTIQPYRDEFVERYGKRNKDNTLVFEDGHYVMIKPIFQTILDVVDNELLGAGAEKMNDQCRGLRVIINTLLTNLNVAHVLCCEDSVDMDKALERGEITVVNFALELGSSGKGLGLFYMLNFINAAYRRPGNEDTRIPNFCYIDELPQLLHPSMEQCFVLFRKYRIAMFVAIQSLSQMNKDKSTAFMQQILIGNCAHHFVFGRAAVEEMDLYEKLAGKSLKSTEMEQVSETSIISDNPTISYGKREQMSLENQIEGGQVHERDFQEVTVITVRKGSPVGVFFGKVSFLPRHKQKIRKKQYCVDWSQYSNKEDDMEREMKVKAELSKLMKVTSVDKFESKEKGVEISSKPAFMSQLKEVDDESSDEKIIEDEFIIDTKEGYSTLNLEKTENIEEQMVSKLQNEKKENDTASESNAFYIELDKENIGI